MTILAGNNRGIWPDASATPTLPTTSYVRASDVFDIGEECELHPRAIVAGVGFAHVAMDVLVSFEPDAATTATSWRRYASRVVQVASLGVHDIGPISLPPRCRAVVEARGWLPDVDSRLSIVADARAPGSRADLAGQPIELAAHQTDGIECFSDGSAGSVVMTVAPGITPEPSAAADQLWIPTGEADTLVVDFAVSVLAATTVELEVRERPVGSAVEVEQVAVNSVAAGVIAQTVAQDQISGTVDTHRTREIPIRPGTEILILAQRTGGGGTTEGYGVARLYRLGRI